MKWYYIIFGILLGSAFGYGSYLSAFASTEAPAILSVWWAALSLLLGVIAIMFLIAGGKLFSEECDKEKTAQ